jgi:hypothetical protein
MLEDILEMLNGGSHCWSQELQSAKQVMTAGFIEL